ncbi:hypothetical protein ACEXOS_015085 [Herbiconiux sp. P16]|uniref:hypothetical protein n=1 Tax=Herbiconiux wuyangfengii TaxID=3342794 RepID=UPI0035BA830A
MADQSWAQPAIQWLLTPALVTGGLLALARLYDPATRWARNLRSDITILGGLPEGSEKRFWQKSVDQQAVRLREYREAFVGWTLFWKWAVVGLVGATILGLILYPPVTGRLPWLPSPHSDQLHNTVASIFARPDSLGYLSLDQFEVPCDSRSGTEAPPERQVPH